MGDAPPADAPTGVADDRALLARLRAGDEAAFDALFRAWYAPLVRVATRLLGDGGEAEEVVQDALFAFWRRRDTLDPDGAAHAYLFQAVRNRALNRLRHGAVARRAAPAMAVDRPAMGSAPAPADAAAAHDALAAAAAAAIDALPPRTREVFAMSRGEGRTYAEIAAALGITVKAVEANMARALRMLRERLADHLPGRR